MNWIKSAFAPKPPIQGVTDWRRARECKCGEFYESSYFDGSPRTICPHCGRYHTHSKLVTGKWHYTYYPGGLFSISHTEYDWFEKFHDA